MSYKFITTKPQLPNSNSSNLLNSKNSPPLEGLGEASNTKVLPSNSKEIASNTKEIASNSKEIASNTKEMTSNTKEIESNSKEMTSNNKVLPSNFKKKQLKTWNLKLETKKFSKKIILK